jgi:PKD repeat protein
MPGGGGSLELVIATSGNTVGSTVAANVPLQLTASSGTLSNERPTTDWTGHTKVTWIGSSSATITAAAGDVVGTAAITVPSATPTPTPPSPSPAPSPTPPPAPGFGPLFVDIIADPRLTDTATPVHFLTIVRPQNPDPPPTGLTYAWDFNEDGVTDSTEATPTYRFVQGKNDYAVVVTVRSADGRLGRGTIHVVVGAAPVPGIDVSVSASPNPAAVNATVTFTAIATPNSTGGTVTQYEWDFDGDGVTDLTTTTASATQSYPTVGTKTVGVTARSPAASGHGAGTVVVSAPALNVTLRASTATPAVGSTITLTATPGVDSGTIPTLSYAWDFGDGTTLTTSGGVTSHAFGTVGVYTVRVTITAPDGRTATNTTTIIAG